jgi:glycerophosphoryl diester phosphodiesterase
MARGMEIVQLIDRAGYWQMLRRVVGDDWIIGPGITELRDHRKLGRRILRSGHDLHVWTVNTKEDLDLCLELGVKAVITDRPAYILDLLGV